MIKVGYASDFNKNSRRPPDSGTVILIARYGGGGYFRG